MEPVTKKIKISLEELDEESALREIARINKCLREKEEEVAQLKKELEDILAARNKGIVETRENSSKSAIFVRNDAESSRNNQPSIKKETMSDHDDSDDEDAETGGGSVSGKKRKWKKRFNLPLLQAYAKYKTELECSDDAQEHEVWSKISSELRCKISDWGRGTCPTNYDGLRCMEKIEELKKEYERLKNCSSISKGKARLFQEAKHAFESDGNAVISPDTSNKWYKNRPLKLLQVYTKYKAQLSLPHVQDHTVWKEIAAELRLIHNIMCDESECRSQMHYLRSKYERIKNQSVTNEETAMFLDTAKQAFEATGTPVAVSDEPSTNLLSVKKRKVGFRLRLLQVYAKYRQELSRPGVQEDKVWERIAREVREYSFNCGAYLCRHELSRMRDQYEFSRGVTSQRLINPIDMRNLLQDARKAFED